MVIICHLQPALWTHTYQVVKVAKLLGVIVDSVLTCWSRISTVIAASMYTYRLLRRLKSLGIPALRLMTVFNLFILLKLIYAFTVWYASLISTE